MCLCSVAEECLLLLLLRCSDARRLYPGFRSQVLALLQKKEAKCRNTLTWSFNHFHLINCFISMIHCVSPFPHFVLQNCFTFDPKLYWCAFSSTLLANFRRILWLLPAWRRHLDRCCVTRAVKHPMWLMPYTAAWWQSWWQHHSFMVWPSHDVDVLCLTHFDTSYYWIVDGVLIWWDFCVPMCTFLRCAMVCTSPGSWMWYEFVPVSTATAGIPTIRLVKVGMKRQIESHCPATMCIEASTFIRRWYVASSSAASQDGSTKRWVAA